MDRARKEVMKGVQMERERERERVGEREVTGQRRTEKML